MKAMDVMVRDVVTVKPETDVASAIKLLIEHDISALPVVDDAGTVVGMLSEADLVRREEIGTEKHRPWWLEALTPGSMLAEDFAKAHGLRVSEVMSPHVVSASVETPQICWTLSAPSNRISGEIAHGGYRGAVPIFGAHDRAQGNVVRVANARWRLTGGRLSSHQGVAGG